MPPKRDSQNRIYFFFGSDEGSLREKVFSLLGPKVNDFSLLSLETMDGQNTSIAEIILNVQTPSLLSQEKCIWVKNLKILEKGGAKEDGIFLELIKGLLPSQNILIFTNTKVDQRFKSVSELKKNSSWEELEITEETLRSFIQETLTAQTKTIQPKACDALINQAGSELGILKSELEKIITYIGSKKVIELNDVEALITSSTEEPFFKFVNEVLSGKHIFSIKTLQTLIQQGENPIGLVTQLFNTLRLLIQAKALIEEGHIQEKKIPTTYRKSFIEEITSSLPQNIKEALPQEAHLLKQHPYRCFLLIQQAQAFSLQQLKNLFLKCAGAYWELVSSRSGEQTLEKFVLGV